MPLRLAGCLASILLLVGPTSQAVAGAPNSSPGRDTRGLTSSRFPIPHASETNASLSEFRRGASYEPGDEHWWDGFGLPSPDGPILCAIEYDGRLVIGGSFTQIGGVPINGIAVWNGAQWSALGGGTDGPVEALFEFQGDLIVGGRFSEVGSTPARGVARWNGQKWSPMGSGLGQPYYPQAPGASAFAVHKGSLIAGGGFLQSGDSYTPFIARWSGERWVPIGNGLDGPLRALVVIGDTLYAAGSFQHAGAYASPAVARLEGTAWRPLGRGLVQSEGYWPVEVRTLLPFAGLLIVGGSFSSADTLPVRNIAAWNGSAWDSLGPGLDYPVSTLLAAGDTLIAGGDGGIAKWAGDHWDLPHPELYGAVNCLLFYQSGYLAGGSITTWDPLDGQPLFGLGLFSGGRWQGLYHWTDRMRGLTAGSYGNVEALTVYRNQLLATGDFYYAGDPPSWKSMYGMAAWDGSSWEQAPFPPYGGSSPRALLAVEDTLDVAGYFYDYAGPSILPIPVLRYDGSSWAPLDTLSLDVTSLARYRGELYAAGHAIQGGTSQASVVRYRNGRWQVVGSFFGPNMYGYAAVSAMLEHGGKLVVAGAFGGVDDQLAASVATWDGDAWEPLDLGLDARAPHRIYSLAGHRGILIAGGRFYPYGTAVQQLEGGVWKPLGSLQGEAVKVLSTGGELFAAGYLNIGTRLSYQPDGVARWDGRAWSPLGSGTNRPAQALAAWRGSLYVGGSFTLAGGHSSFSIARWDGLRSSLSAPRVAIAPGVPNPFRTSSSFTYRLSEPGRVRVSVFDARGRQVALLEEGAREPGEHTVVWNGRRSDGKLAATGVYFLKIQLPGGLEKTRKTVLLR
jgi:hypothetical protein